VLLRVNRQLLLAVTVSLSLIFLLSIIKLAPAIHRQLNAWKVLPQPERLTELYFTDHTKLPSTYAKGDSQTVAFTVHNLEYRETQYHYILSETDQTSNVSTDVTSGDFKLEQNKFQKITIPITLSELGPTAKVTVRLSGQDESIDYLLHQTAAKATNT
jgi:uncharacterized membrane protein